MGTARAWGWFSHERLPGGKMGDSWRTGRRHRGLTWLCCRTQSVSLALRILRRSAGNDFVIVGCDGRSISMPVPPAITTPPSLQQSPNHQWELDRELLGPQIGQNPFFKSRAGLEAAYLARTPSNRARDCRSREANLDLSVHAFCLPLVASTSFQFALSQLLSSGSVAPGRRAIELPLR